MPLPRLAAPDREHPLHLGVEQALAQHALSDHPRRAKEKALHVFEPLGGCQFSRVETMGCRSAVSQGVLPAQGPEDALQAYQAHSLPGAF